jgi:Abnormal spindle-like microcephaly-assoc'd, ASPM-SPD-2-Hydin/PQQ-like domain
MAAWRGRTRLPLAVLLLIASTIVAGSLGAHAASASPPVVPVTAGSDALRTAWYPDQPGLTPAIVSGGTFGQLFSAPVTGQVYAQPLVSNGTLFIATEDDNIYGLDPQTGAVQWSRNVGTPWNPVDLGCGDLVPNVGITATPVIDPSGTGTAYFSAKTYASGTSGPARWDLHAVDLATGQEKPGFPVQIQGTADNAPGVTFDATHELQRPALLLMDGVVYLSFGAHCDKTPYRGWVAGVSTTGTLKALWAAIESPSVSGAGIWQSGGGLVSDGSGRIFLATGNGGSEPADASPILGSTPPPDLGESVVRLQVQPNGTLAAADFFMPYNAANLDSFDADISASAPVALPSSFGGTAGTNLLLQIGKQGRLYLLDRNGLGGYRNGTGGGDATVGTIDGNEGVWARPAVWPGDGGYVWFPTASGGASAGGSAGHLVVYRSTTVGGAPSLVEVAESPDTWAYSSSGPVITSNGTQPGSGIVWIVRSTGGSGASSQLLAYQAVPGAGGTPVQLWDSGTFTSSKFNPPGVGPNGHIYVGTRDGTVLGFGYPVGVPLMSPGVNFSDPQTVGTTSAPQSVTLTATAQVQIDSLSSSNTEFSLGTPGAPLPTTLNAGGTLTVPVTFSPTDPGTRAATLTVVTDHGSAQFGMSGTGRLPTAHLLASRTLLDFGGLPIGEQATQGVTFTNDGAQVLTVQSSAGPSAPFVAASLPSPGTQLAPGASVTVNVQFSPTATGTFTDNLQVNAGAAGSVTVAISGSSATPGVLKLSKMSINFGNVGIGNSATATFTLHNSGGSTLSIEKSKPPALGPFTATSTLDEGTSLTAGETLTESVRFTPGVLGHLADGWNITADDSLGQHRVKLQGAGMIPDPKLGGWTLNPSASLVKPLLDLTPATAGRTGTGFWPSPFATGPASVTFTSTIGKGKGGDGLALLFADATSTTPTAVGGGGDGVGFLGIHGIAIVLGTHKGAGDPSANFVGISDGVGGVAGQLHWIVTSTSVPSLHGTHLIKVSSDGTKITVSIDGKQYLSVAVSLPASVLMGFSAASGGAELHAVSAVAIT